MGISYLLRLKITSCPLTENMIILYFSNQTNKLLGEHIMKIFNESLSIPKYLDKHRKLNSILSVVLSCIVMPILSIVMVTSSGKNLVSTSISKIGWQSDMLAVAYFWGIFHLAIYCYLLKLALDQGKYSKPAKIFFYTLFGIGCLFLLVGLSVPFTNIQTPEHINMRKYHNGFATSGFVMFVIVIMLLSLSTIWRNKKQALISIGSLCFLIISGVFAVLCVNSPEKVTFITAAAQMYIFSMLLLLLLTQYFMNATLKNEYAKPQEIAESKTKTA